MQPNWESEWPEDAIGSFVSMVAFRYSFTTTAKKILDAIFEWMGPRKSIRFKQLMSFLNTLGRCVV